MQPHARKGAAILLVALMLLAEPTRAEETDGGHVESATELVALCATATILGELMAHEKVAVALCVDFIVTTLRKTGWPARVFRAEGDPFVPSQCLADQMKNPDNETLVGFTWRDVAGFVARYWWLGRRPGLEHLTPEQATLEAINRRFPDCATAMSR